MDAPTEMNPAFDTTTELCQLPNSGTELEVLTGFIDFSRSVLLRKTEGLSDQQLRTALAPSTMTLAGMLTHMAFVEDYWFGFRVAGRAPTEPWATAPWESNNDWDWDLAADIPTAEARALFADSLARSREITAGLADLSAPVAKPAREGEAWNVRWVLVHMIEEYSRHLGHADLIREHLDGSTGD
ncbi:DinB family protein [Brevibacterium otitidis]|uniref:DinB family protein n=1 Tax=Brevibacterium otitidis TaxID=53364 RepID=A0ABV5X1U3_9MICO